MTSTAQDSNPDSAEAAAEFTFDRYELVTGIAKRPTVVPGFFLGGAVAELAVVKVDENDDRLLSIYAFDDNTWRTRLDTKLRPEVLFVDVTDIGGRDWLITYEPGRVNRFDAETETETALIEVTSGFDPPRKNEIPHVDITRDVNGDGRDDFVVPGEDGFWVHVQSNDGTFADAVKIGPATDLGGIYGADGYRYDPWSQSRIHEVDYDQDGRTDLVYWNADRFAVHLQDERGLFAAAPKFFTTDVAFGSDVLYSLAEGDMTGTVLHSFADLNSDGVADLVTCSLQGKKVRKKESVFEVHYGRPIPEGGTAWESGADIAFQSEDRIQVALDCRDFNGDGELDVMVTSIEKRFLTGSIWKSLKGMFGDDIWLDLEFYRMEGGRYPDKPSATHRVALDGAPSHREPGSVSLDIVLRGGTHEHRKTEKRWPRAFNRPLLIGDVTGDGHSDLLIGRTPDGMDVFAGVPGPEVFTQRSQGVAVVLPSDGEYTRLVDLNQDGKQDILMHHPFTLRDVHGGRKRPPGTEPHRLSILIAR